MIKFWCSPKNRSLDRTYLTLIIGNGKDGVSYKFDLWNPDISCNDDDDLVSHDSLIGFLERKETESTNICRKFEELNDYEFIKTNDGHDLKFISSNACSENHYPKDLITIFRFTCDYNAPSKTEFMSMKTSAPCTRVFEIVSGEAWNMHYIEAFSLDLASKSYKNLKYVTISAAMIAWSLYLIMIYIRNKTKNEKLRYKTRRYNV